MVAFEHHSVVAFPQLFGAVDVEIVVHFLHTLHLTTNILINAILMRF
jgi:hypothetical protein